MYTIAFTKVYILSSRECLGGTRLPVRSAGQVERHSHSCEFCVAANPHQICKNNNKRTRRGGSGTFTEVARLALLDRVFWRTVCLSVP